MSRAGPVSRAASVCREPGWSGCHVIAKLIFIAFDKRSEIPDTSPANQASPAHLIRPLEGKDKGSNIIMFKDFFVQIRYKR